MEFCLKLDKIFNIVSNLYAIGHRPIGRDARKVLEAFLTPKGGGG